MRDRFLEPEENYAAPVTRCDDEVHTEDCLHFVLVAPFTASTELTKSIARAIGERLKDYLPWVEIGKPSNFGWEVDTLESCDEVNERAQLALSEALYEAGIDEP